MPRPKKGYDNEGNPDGMGIPPGNEEPMGFLDAEDGNPASSGSEQGNVEPTGIPPEAERLIARAKGQKARNHQGKGIPQGKGEPKGIRALVPALSFRGIPYRERLGPWGPDSPLQMQAERIAAGAVLVHDPGDPSGLRRGENGGQEEHDRRLEPYLEGEEGRTTRSGA